MNHISVSLQKKRKLLYLKIQKAANKTNRSVNDIKVVAVTKSQPSPIWDFAFSNYFSILAENRIKETKEKQAYCVNRNKIELHMIGRIQSNKAKQAVDMFDVIQTVDSLKLANRINNISKDQSKTSNIFLQVNSSKDPLKQGFSIEKIFQVIPYIDALENLKVCGIMTIPHNNLKEDKLRDVYKLTREIRDKIYDMGIKNCTNLSMGMSGDFEIAIEEGSTHVRIGTALFGGMNKWS